jgi:hypothetical protein
MGFLTNLVSATVKTALTPIAVVKDAVDVVRGEEPETTKSLLSSAAEDVKDAADDIGDGEIL